MALDGTYNLDPKILNALNDTISTAFNKQMEGQERVYGGLMMTMNVNTNQVTLPYMDDLGDGLNAWDRDATKKLEQLGGGKYVVDINSYEKTIAIRREDIEDDNLGLYLPIIQGMAENVVQNDDKLIADLLVSGASLECFDGANFFSNSHVTQTSTTYDNLLSGALSSGTIETGITTMRKFKGRNGKVLNIVPDTIIVPPDLEPTARRYVNSNVRVGATNEEPNWLGSVVKNVIVDARLTDTDDWYLVKASGAMKPFVKIQRTAPRFVNLTRMDTDTVFLKGQYVYGLETRYTMAYGLWQYAIKFVN